MCIVRINSQLQQKNELHLLASALAPYHCNFIFSFFNLHQSHGGIGWDHAKAREIWLTSGAALLDSELSATDIHPPIILQVNRKNARFAKVSNIFQHYVITNLQNLPAAGNSAVRSAARHAGH